MRSNYDWFLNAICILLGTEISFSTLSEMIFFCYQSNSEGQRSSLSRDKVVLLKHFETYCKPVSH